MRIPAIAIVVAACALGRTAFGSPRSLQDHARDFASGVGQPALADQIAPQAAVPEARERVLPRDGWRRTARDEALRQELRNIDMLRDPHARNEALERCFNANKHQLGYSQTESILRSVGQTDYDGAHPYDRDNSIERIVAGWVRQWSAETGAEMAVRMAHWNRDAHAVNRQVEDYYNAEAGKLNPADIEVLIFGLRPTDINPDHEHDRDKSIKRITENFLNVWVARLFSGTAVALARWNDDGHVVNGQIERFFHATKGRLRQSDVDSLLVGLCQTDCDSCHPHDRDSTRERILKAWSCSECVR